MIRRRTGPVAVVLAHRDDDVIGVGLRRSSDSGPLLQVLATTGEAGDCHAAIARADARARAASRLRLPFAHDSLAHRLDELTCVIEAMLQSMRPAAVITHPYEGGHPDHDAVSFAVSAAIARWPGGSTPAPRHLEFAGYREGEHGELVADAFGGLRKAPGYDYSRPPNGGRVWYDHLACGIDSASWCRRAAACLASLRAPLYG
jgi:LmbE family N-acetylglucosaminyl deacetylase